MKKIVFVFLLALASIVAVGCGKKPIDDKNKDANKTAKGYGITHKNYVGVATIKVKNGVVHDVEFDEVYLPDSWAKVEKGEELPEDVIEYGSNWYAKYIVIGDKQFTGTLRTEDLTIDEVKYTAQRIKYSATGIEDLYLYIRESEANAKWYVEKALADKAYIADKDFEKSNYTSAGPNGWTKSETNYWPASEDSLGWVGNLEKVATAIKGTKMDQLSDIKRTDEVWYIGDVTTGATLVDFKDYYLLAQRAFKNANK